jgi:hypothetical protein
MATQNLRWVAIGLAVMVAAAAALPVPAGAQFFDDRYPFSQRRQQEPPQGYFSFPFFNGERAPHVRPPQPVESTKAPSPKKQETPPTSTVVVIGDSLADWLGYGLEEAFADSPEIGVVRKIRPTSGLVRYEARNDTLEWSQAVKDILATEKPNAIVVMLGLNDRVSLRDRAPPHQSPAGGQAPGDAAQGKTTTAPSQSETGEGQRTQNGTYEFHTDKWAELYSKRIDDMIAALKSKGAPVLWVGLPAIRGKNSTSDVNYLDELYRERAEKAGITYVDIWDGFVDESGRYTVQGPDFEGQTRRLRTGDGVHFTKAGAVKLAHYVEHELRRVMSNHIAPVALPAPEEQSPAKGSAPGPRPVAGPVVPLTATAGAEPGDLLGGGGRSAAATPDPIVTRVLNQGDPVAAPTGRADDFSWPHPAASVSTPDTEPEPVAVTPPVPAKKGAVKNEGKTDAKNNKTPPEPAVRARRSPTAGLDGAAATAR